MASPLPPSPPFPHAGEAASLLSSLFWAAAGIAFRTLKGRVPAVAINLGKNAVATVCFAVALALSGGGLVPSVPGGAHALLAASGLLGLSACDTLYLRSILSIGPRRASIVFMLAPVLVFLAACLPPFGQADALARPVTWIGLACALAGIAGAASEQPDRLAAPGEHAAGVRDAALAAVLQAAGNLLARAAVDAGAGSPVEAAHLRLVWGTVGLLAGGLAFGRLRSWSRALARPAVVSRLAPAAFFGTFLGIGLNQAGLAWSASTGVAATINSMAPVWLVPLSAVFLGERHGARAWASTLLAVGGVALLTL